MRKNNNRQAALPLILSAMPEGHFMVRPVPEAIVEHKEAFWKDLITKQLRRQGLKPYFWGEDDSEGIYCYAERQLTYQEQMAAKFGPKPTVKPQKRA